MSQKQDSVRIIIVSNNKKQLYGTIMQVLRMKTAVGIKSATINNLSMIRYWKLRFAEEWFHIAMELVGVLEMEVMLAVRISDQPEKIRRINLEKTMA